MGETNVLNKWFLYSSDEPFIPVFWNDKYLVYFNDETSANRFINELINLWQDYDLGNYLYTSNKEITYINDKAYDITNCYPKYLEVRSNEEEDWHYETHLFDRDTDEFIL